MARKTVLFVLWTTVAASVLVLGPPVQASSIDTEPPSQPANPRWTDEAGLLVESASAGDTRVRAMWNPSADGGSGIARYRVQVSEAPDFVELVTDQHTATAGTNVYLDADDGIEFNHAYYFRVAAVDGAANESTWSAPSNEVGVRRNSDGPAVAHAPVMVAHHGRTIPIDVVSTCGIEGTCTATLGYRATPIPTALVDYDATLGSGFTRVPLERTGVTWLNGRDAVEWSGEIPGDVVTTTGVDYFIEVEDTFATGYFPGTTFVGTAVTGVDGTGTYHHVHTLTPPVGEHTPPPFGRSDEAMRLDLTATCSTDACDATVYFRTTDASFTGSEGIAAENGELLATPDWPSVEMTPVTTTASVGGVADVIVYRADVPASYVDTRGVDYFFHVSDGSTQAWLPGTTYQGYYAPQDGMRTGYYHVRVAETSHIVHTPVVTASYGEDVQVSATTNCPSTRDCQATLSYRTTDGDVLAGVDGFTSVSMEVSWVETVDGNDVVRLRGWIPAEVVDTRGVDYFLSVTDGATTSWWPGAEPNDGYLWHDGIRLAYHHVHVTEPPHLVHVPPVAVPALEDLDISTELWCATEACAVELSYSTGVEAQAWVTVPMAKVGVQATTDAGRLEQWTVTVPGTEVTTRGFAYVILASDGYAHTAAPGTAYAGAYVQVDGGPVAVAGVSVAFAVRVLEPPHPLTVPVQVVEPGAEVTVEATSNCATDACTATLHWRTVGEPWQQTEMDVTASVLAEVTADVWAFGATIPGEAVVEAGVDYYVAVSDGYVVEVTVTAHVFVTHVPELVGPLEPLEGTVMYDAGLASGTVIAEFWVDDIVVARWEATRLQVWWDTTDVADGTHEIWMRIADRHGNTVTSAKVLVSVVNGLSASVESGPVSVTV